APAPSSALRRRELRDRYVSPQLKRCAGGCREQRQPGTGRKSGTSSSDERVPGRVRSSGGKGRGLHGQAESAPELADRAERAGGLACLLTRDRGQYGTLRG